MVIFDEFHERSLNADLGLALCLDAQEKVREDLRILVMSATLERRAVAQLLGDAPIVTCRGPRIRSRDALGAGRGREPGRRTRHRHRYANRAHNCAGTRATSRATSWCFCPARERSAAPSNSSKKPVAARRASAAAVRRPVACRAGRSDSPRRRAASQDRARHQHRRDQPHDRRRAHRRRLRAGAPIALRSCDRNEPPGNGAHLARIRRSAARARRETWPRRVLPIVDGKRARLPARANCAGNPGSRSCAASHSSWPSGASPIRVRCAGSIRRRQQRSRKRATCCVRSTRSMRKVGSLFMAARWRAWPRIRASLT